MDAETLGYRGGAMLALHADVELRRQGRPGLLQLIADLLQQDDRRLQLERLRAWMEANGLKEFYARSIAQPARFPDVDATLASLGFELEVEAASLTYLGIQVEGDAARGRVVAVDPEGPTAAAGVKVGDEIVGWFPTRTRPPRVGKAVTTKYRFGLACIA
jgi:predicted metalloprotease with PDZ domain